MIHGSVQKKKSIVRDYQSGGTAVIFYLFVNAGSGQILQHFGSIHFSNFAIKCNQIFQCSCNSGTWLGEKKQNEIVSRSEQTSSIKCLPFIDSLVPATVIGNGWSAVFPFFTFLGKLPDWFVLVVDITKFTFMYSRQNFFI